MPIAMKVVEGIVFVHLDGMKKGRGELSRYATANMSPRRITFASVTG